MNIIFDYALNSIFRYGLKNILITIIFGILVFLLSSVIFITNSLKAEYKGISQDLPDILVQRYYGGKAHFIDEKMVDEFLLMPSVSSVQPRIWGQYHFERESVYLTLFGVQSYQKHFDKSIDEIATNLDELDGDFMVASKRVYEFLQKYFRAHDLVLVPFFTPNGDLISLKKGGVFKSQNSLLNNDIILLSEENARKILGVPNGQFSDILLEISNKAEVDFLADKIRRYHQDLRVITKSEMLRKYENLYDFKSGWFLALLLTSVLAFAIILYDKASGLRSEEKREIAILKALGWDISDIIKFKLIESVILSVLTFFIALNLAIFFVYFLKAPILSEVFSGFSNLKLDFDLIFVFDFKLVVLLFLLSVPLYVAVSIIPAYKASVRDIGEVLR